MRIENLTQENVSDLKEFLTQDIAEWIGRNFVSGFVLLPEDEPSPAAGIVWQLVAGEDEYETDCRILFIKAEDDESADALLLQFSGLVAEMGCEGSLFELPVSLGDVEKKALEKAGFTLGETYPKPLVDHAKAREAALAALKATRDEADED